MSRFSSDRAIRTVLRVDAASCIGCGALQLAALQPMAGLLGLPSALLLDSGVFLAVYAAVVGLVAARRHIPRAFVLAVAVGNAGWCLGCIGWLLAGGVRPTALGVAWVLMQAVTVAVLAALQAAWLAGSASRREALAA